MDQVRFGVVGLGNMGSVHAMRHIPILQRASLTAVCDVVPDKMAPYENAAKFTDSRDLIRSGLVDALLVATPHYDHTPIGVDAFENGLHLLVEKPIAVHKKLAQELIDAKRPNLVFSAMFQTRTSSAFQTIKRLIASGELGEVRRVNWIITNWFRPASYYASGGWRATWGGEGGGVLLNQAPHNLDLFQWLFGLPVKVSAHCKFGKYHDIEVEDAVTAYVEFENGATGVLVTTTGEAPGTDRLEVAGDRGRLVYEEGRITFDRTEESVQNFNETTPDLFPSMKTWSCQVPSGNTSPSHLKILENFVACILDGAPLIAPGEEGIKSVELANSMLLSTWLGRPVSIPIDADEYARELQAHIDSSTHRKVVSEQTAGDMAASFH